MDVRFAALQGTVKPSAHMDVLRPLLPVRYAPLRPNGAGLQSVYLTRLPEEFAGALMDLLGAEAHSLVLNVSADAAAPGAAALGLVQWEEHELQRVQADASLPDTDRLAIVLARRGQGLIKQRVMQIESACRVTGSISPNTCGRVIASRGGTPATRSASMAKTACSSHRAWITCLIAGSSHSRTAVR